MSRTLLLTVFGASLALPMGCSKDKSEAPPPPASAAVKPAVATGGKETVDFSKPVGHCDVKAAHYCVDLWGDDRSSRETCSTWMGTWSPGKACEVTATTLGTCTQTEDVLGDVPQAWKKVYWTDTSVDDFGRKSSIEHAKELCGSEKPEHGKLVAHEWKDGPAASGKPAAAKASAAAPAASARP
jgi:hypothetical protein